MNSKIFKYLKLKSELSADDLKQAESLASMTETDKQALIEFLGGKAKVSKPVKTRVIEKCGACNYTRRAAHHKEGHKDYHEFQSSKGKSARASSLADAIKKTAKEPRCVACYEFNDHPNHDLDSGGHEFETGLSARAIKTRARYEICRALVDDNGREMECGKRADDNVHHLATTDGYHEFQAETAVEVGG